MNFIFEIKIIKFVTGKTICIHRCCKALKDLKVLFLIEFKHVILSFVSYIYQLLAIISYAACTASTSQWISLYTWFVFTKTVSLIILHKCKIFNFFSDFIRKLFD